MKLSLSWLKQWVKYTSSEFDLAERLTSAGLETSIISSTFTSFKGVIVGEILSVRPHPNADRLKVCEVKTGVDTTSSIVCGAFNVRPGLRVPTALPNAQLPNGIIIRSRMVRDIKSEGMLCSISELGLQNLFTQEAATGILELPEDIPLGCDLWKHLNLGEPILDIQVPPNRGDCLSTLGLARELSILNQLDFKRTPTTEAAVTTQRTLSIQVEHPIKCPRYTGRVILNLNNALKTPAWIVTRLSQGGMHSINPIIDVINYSLLELGAPLHAFDLEHLLPPLSVRMARANETLCLLNNKTVPLEPNTVVIADQKAPLAMAGIIGGLSSAVTTKTVNIFLESAFFTPDSILGKARQYGLVTESSYRFERGIDPELCKEALDNVTQLLVAICGGEAGPITTVESYEHLPNASIINLDFTKIKQVLGIPLDRHTTQAQLKRIGMQLLSSPTETTWQLKSPSWRSDLTESCDLIEETARLVGYNNIPYTLPSYHLSFEPTKQNDLTHLKTCLAHQGYYEVINYSFTSSHYQKLFDPDTSPILLTNPISSELNVLRTQLWSGLIKNLQHNQNYHQNAHRFFEVGSVFIKTDRIREHLTISGIVTGTRFPEQWGVPKQTVDFFDVKQTVDNSLQQLDPTAHYDYHACAHPALSPSESSQLFRNGQTIGWIGALHPRLYEYFNLTNPIYLFEWRVPNQLPSYMPTFKAFSRFPYVQRDIAFWVSKTISFDSIKQLTALVGGEYLKNIGLFDVYQAKERPTQKSLALHLIWQHPTQTFKDSEVDNLQATVIQKLQQSFNIQLR